MCSSHWCCRSMVNQKLFFWSWRKDSHLKAVLAPFLEPETVWPEGRLWKTFGRYHKFKICTQSSSTAIPTTQNGPCFRTTPPSSRSLVWLDKKRWANNLEKHMRSIHFWVSLAHFLAFLCNVRKVHSASIKHWHSSYHNLQGLRPDGSLVIRPIPFELRRISFRICKLLQRTRYISFSVSKPALASDELPCHEIFCIYQKILHPIRMSDLQGGAACTRTRRTCSAKNAEISATWVQVSRIQNGWQFKHDIF